MEIKLKLQETKEFPISSYSIVWHGDDKEVEYFVFYITGLAKGQLNLCFANKTSTEI